MNYVIYLESDLGIPHEAAQGDQEAVFEELFWQRLHEDVEVFGDIQPVAAEEVFTKWRASRLGLPAVGGEAYIELPHAS